jgi:hypothetical protein
MGAWGYGTFENDVAADWVYGLESEGLEHIPATLRAVLEDDDYLDSDIASEGLAAAEVVARLSGRPGEDVGDVEELDAWLGSNRIEPPPEWVAAALAAVDRVVAPNSELADLWGETEDVAAWRASVADLRQRLAT